MAMSDWTTGINTATEKGIEQGIGIGIEQGAMQKQIEIAKKSLNTGLPIEIIHEITGLDMETIQSLQ
jgi:predicted transposase/invertase (TIGR01784 family)